MIPFLQTWNEKITTKQENTLSKQTLPNKPGFSLCKGQKIITYFPTICGHASEMSNYLEYKYACTGLRLVVWCGHLKLQ